MNSFELESDMMIVMVSQFSIGFCSPPTGISSYSEVLKQMNDDENLFTFRKNKDLIQRSRKFVCKEFHI